MFAICDYGADMTAMPSSMFNDILRLEKDIKVEESKPPIEIDTAV